MKKYTISAIFLIIIASMIHYNISKKKVIDIYKSSMYGDWQINSSDSRTISQLCSNSSSVRWDKFEKAISGKNLSIDSDRIVCNSINAGKPMRYSVYHADSFYCCLRVNDNMPLLVKMIDSNTLRVDWSVNIVEIYNRIQ